MRYFEDLSFTSLAHTFFGGTHGASARARKRTVGVILCWPTLLGSDTCKKPRPARLAKILFVSSKFVCNPLLQPDWTLNAVD